MAHISGAVIVPVSVRAENAWYFKSWDKFQLPKPFSKLTISYDDMIEIQEGSNAQELEAYRMKLESVLKPKLITNS